MLRLRAAQQQIDVLETTLKHRDHYIVRLEQLVKYVVDRERERCVGVCRYVSVGVRRVRAAC